MSNTPECVMEIRVDELDTPQYNMDQDRMKEVFKMCRGLRGDEKPSKSLLKQLEEIRKENKNKHYEEVGPSKEMVELIYSVKKAPRSLKDKVFLVKWLHCNVTNCSYESIETLEDCESDILDFICYWKAVKRIAEKVKGVRQPLPVLSQVFQDRWLTQEDFEEEKEVIANIGGWKWKEIEQTWNEMIFSADSTNKMLRIECFHTNIPTSSLSSFEFINKNIFSEEATSETLAASNERFEGCECKCRTICGICSEKVALKGARHVKNKALEFDSEANSFCTAICGKQSRCIRIASCRRFPRRQSVLLIATQPRVNGFGVFALKNIRKGEIITEVVGEVFMKDEIEKKASYQFDLINKFIIDVSSKGNESRFVNHSSDPNCALLHIFVDNVHSFPRLFIFAKEDIKSGDELTIDHPNVPLDEEEE